VAELLRADARATMPPQAWWLDGRDPIVAADPALFARCDLPPTA
jgi:hypothetical protein